MPSPVRPEDFCSAVPTGTSSLCDRIQAVFLRVPRLLCDFFSWAINSDGTLTDNFIREVAAFPVGAILPYASTLSPAGWLRCNGAEVSRTEYAQLYAVIGTRYGLGNGTTTFNVPNLNRKFLVGYDPADGAMQIADTGGEENHILTISELPAHTHTMKKEDGVGFDFDGSRSAVGDSANASHFPTTMNTGSTGQDVGHNTMPPFSAVAFLIRY